MLMWIAWFVSSALAYETDQLTDRDKPLIDSQPYANAVMDTLLQELVEEMRGESCDADDDKLRDVIARHLREHTDGVERVPERGFWRSFGYGYYGAALERAPIEKRTFADRSDIYGEIPFFRGVILHTAGTCSTINMGGVLIGVDKVDHFLTTGYDLWSASRGGKSDAAAIRWSTHSENTWLGHFTSGGFSYGDIAANWDGYQFYSTLLTPKSVLGRDEAGCVVRQRDWDWAEWVDSDWDEVTNPNVYTRGVQKEVSARLLEERDSICASYARWGRAAYQEGLATRLASPVTGSNAKAPPRSDPFKLDELCAGEPAKQSATD